MSLAPIHAGDGAYVRGEMNGDDGRASPAPPADPIPGRGSNDESHSFVGPQRSRPSPDVNTSYGPRIDADRWDFHDGIDLPAPAGTRVHAMANGTVFRAGPADKTSAGLGFGSTHVILKVQDPADGQDDLFLVYLHLDSIATGAVPGSTVQQGDVIGAVGQEDATYPHLHFEFRKGDAREASSVHPLRYLPYVSTANFTQLRVDRCNFYRAANEDRRAVRLRFDVTDRREGDVHGVDVELGDAGGNVLTFHVNFDERATIVSDKGDEHAFKNGIAVEGYQKSSLKAEGVSDLRYGVIVRDITSAFTSVKLQVVDVQSGPAETATFPLPTLEPGEERVNSRVDRRSAAARLGITTPARNVASRSDRGSGHRPALSGSFESDRSADPWRASLHTARPRPGPADVMASQRSDSAR